MAEKWNGYLKLKSKILLKSKGTYIMPVLFLILEIVATLLLSTFISKNHEIRENIFKTTILSAFSITNLFLIASYVIYLTQIIYYEDKTNGIKFLMYSKPISKRKIFFSDLVVILIPTFILALLFWATNSISYYLFDPKISHLVAYIFAGLCFIVLSTIFIILFSYLICVKVSRKMFSFVALTPLFVGQIISLVAIVDQLSYRKNFAEISQNIKSKRLLPFKFNNQNEPNINLLNNELTKNSLKNVPLAKDYAIKGGKLISRLDLYKDKSPIFPYISWLMLHQHATNLNELFANDTTDQLKWKINYLKNIPFKNTGATIFENILNADNIKTNYVFSQINALSKEEFSKKIASLIAMYEHQYNISKNQQLKDTIIYLSKINSYADIYNSNEFKNFIDDAKKLILPKMPSFTNEFTTTYWIIKEAILGKYGPLEANKNIDEAINNSTFYKKHPLFKTILAPHALSLYLTAQHFISNKDTLNKINLKSLNTLKKLSLLNSTNEEILKAYEFSNNIDLVSHDRRMYSLIDFGLMENDDNNIMQVSKVMHYPNWISIIFFAILIGSLLPITYMVHMKENYK